MNTSQLIHSCSFLGCKYFVYFSTPFRINLTTTKRIRSISHFLNTLSSQRLIREYFVCEADRRVGK
ncbi:hypothetical protein QW060_21460 [Myroides ceti]|uniref:Uncharacterized protein n=1 Tax=Paenimyroides ceti TaxID=395087 RepID=A0ABT8CZ76_9FLAO|nr:hypothetical protein [Paenimyroides ceti]MDN3708370.1 hypothetical protein [Paenimyroides ceti]MDN3709545.1 hypothetical protein [Paenimyroides ceti]